MKTIMRMQATEIAQTEVQTRALHLSLRSALCIILAMLACSPVHITVALDDRVVDLAYDWRESAFIIAQPRKLWRLKRDRSLSEIPVSGGAFAFHSLEHNAIQKKSTLLALYKDEEGLEEAKGQSAVVEFTATSSLRIYATQHLKTGIPRNPGHLALDFRGAVYFTDRRLPAIYTIANDQVTLFMENSHLRSGDEALGGIAFHRGNFLLVSQLKSGAIYKVPLQNPYNFQPVQIEETLPGAHKLLWSPGQELIGVFPGGLYFLSSNDEWESAISVQRIANEHLSGATLAGQTLLLATAHLKNGSPLAQAAEGSAQETQAALPVNTTLTISQYRF